MDTPRRRWFDLGPHAFYDLVRLARRGRSTLVRVLYVLVLFGALAATYHDEATAQRHRFWEGLVNPREDIVNRNARIAQRFSVTILMTQNMAVLVLMPIYIAASIFEERTRRTLPLLFTTYLSAWDIVVGKWLSRVGVVGAVLLSGLPVLAFAQLWGGIDMPMIAANFWHTGMLLLVVGAFSMVVAIRSKTLTSALVKSYASLAGGFFCCLIPSDVERGKSLVLLMPWTDTPTPYWGMFNMLLVLTLILAAVTFALLAGAARWLEQQRNLDPPLQKVQEAEAAFYSAFSGRPPVADHAIEWKERHTDRPLSFDVPIYLFLMYLWILVICVAFRLKPDVHDAEISGLADVLRAMASASMGFLLLALTIRLTGCIVRERQLQTLDSLLLLPMTPREILSALLRGNLLRNWPWFVLVAVTLAGLFCFGAGFSLAALGFLVLGAIHVYFFAMLGLCLSIWCRTMVSAYVSLAVIMSALFLGPYVLVELSGLQSIAALSPIACWISVWTRAPLRPEESGSIAAYVLGAVVLHRLAHALFARHAARS